MSLGQPKFVVTDEVTGEHMPLTELLHRLKKPTSDESAFVAAIRERLFKAKITMPLPKGAPVYAFKLQPMPPGLDPASPEGFRWQMAEFNRLCLMHVEHYKQPMPGAKAYMDMLREQAKFLGFERYLSEPQELDSAVAKVENLVEASEGVLAAIWNQLKRLPRSHDALKKKFRNSMRRIRAVQSAARRNFLAYLVYATRAQTDPESLADSRLPEHTRKYGLPFLADVHLQMIATLLFRPLAQVKMPPRFYKALADDTPILTPVGWRRHGDLRAGDMVYAPNGKPVKVLAVTGSEVQPAMRVEFSDGNSIVASHKHRWPVAMDCEKHRCYGSKGRHRHKRTVETKNLLAEAKNRKGYRKPSIELAAPIELPYRDLPIDPYLLGLWLGDGNSQNAYIVVGDEDLPHMRQYGRVRNPRPRYNTVLPDGLHTRLSQAGLLLNKHVPAEYLVASIPQRLALLRGLMDTDGHIAKSGQCFFGNTRENIARAVQLLVQSLGSKATFVTRRASLNGKDCGPYHSVLFCPHSGLNPFLLERKRARVLPEKRRIVTAGRRYIRAVTDIGEMSMQCITVEGGLYVAGQACVPTCNSQTMAAMCAWWLGRNPNERVCYVMHAQPDAEERRAYIARLVTGPAHQAVFPHCRVDRRRGVQNNRRSITLVRTISAPQPSLFGVGFEARVDGKGFTKIVFDDAIARNDRYEVRTRRRHVEALNATWMNRLDPGAQVKDIGTPWAADDMHAAFARYPGVVARDLPVGQDFESPAPEIKNADELRAMYVNAPAEFSQTHWLKPYTDASSPISELRLYNGTSQFGMMLNGSGDPPEGCARPVIWVSVDPNASDKAGACSCAALRCAFYENKLYVTHGEHWKHKPRDTRDRLARLGTADGPWLADFMLIEIVSGYEYLLLELQELLGIDRIRRYSPMHRNKTARMEDVTSLVDTGRVLLRGVPTDDGSLVVAPDLAWLWDEVVYFSPKLPCDGADAFSAIVGYLRRDLGSVSPTMAEVDDAISFRDRALREFERKAFEENSRVRREKRLPWRTIRPFGRALRIA